MANASLEIKKYKQKLAAFSTGILIEILEEFHDMMIYRERNYSEEDLRILDPWRMPHHLTQK